MKKAIFGGTFDPIHNGHLHIAYEALYYFDLDEVIFMPSGNPPHKTEKNITDANLRYELVKMAVREEHRFFVSNYEIKAEGLSYTYKTLEYFKELEPNTKWFFITGADCLMELNTWKNVNTILECASLVVFNRPGYLDEELFNQKKKVESKYGKEILLLDLKLLEISSTNIKNMIKEDKNASYLLPSNVYNTVKELGIYK